MVPTAPARHVTMRRSALLALVAAVVVLLSPASGAHPVAAAPTTAAVAAASPGHESQFVDRINSLRASKGLGTLQVHGELLGVARAWTDRMVQAGQISHNPNLGSQVSGGWTKLGENVGVGYSVDGLMAAFIDSPAHYKNLVDGDWTHVGVGVTVAGDGRLYTTHNFMALPQSAPPPPPAPPPSPSPGPSAGRSAPVPAPPAPAAAPSAPDSAAPAPPPEDPQPTEARVTALLGALRSLEQLDA